jgi:hypothetical protein
MPAQPFANLDQQPHDRVAVCAGQALRRADRVALDKRIHDLDAAGKRGCGSLGLSKCVVCSMIDSRVLVNGSAYMDFKEATDQLFDRIDHADLANALGVSVAKIRQSRLYPGAKAHRPAPEHWPEAVLALARARIRKYEQLIAAIDAERGLPLFDKGGAGSQRPAGSRRGRR